MLTKEQIDKNFALYVKKLNSVGVETSKLVEVYGDKIAKASFTISNEYGNAYEGSLIEIVLKILTPYAVRLNGLFPEKVQVDKNELVKVCLLHHIAKAIRLIPNDNQWEVEKRSLIYKYDTSLPSIRTGLHSLLMAQECGIPFTAQEAEALTINDRDLTDDQARWHSSIMASIVRQANEMTYLTINQN